MSINNIALIERFYTAFQERNSDAMVACYADDIEFSDPVFPSLSGARAGAMWKMLCSRASDLEIVFSDVKADETKGAAHWEARYTFTQTGRKVHNVIEARFTFLAGRIVRHVDDFDFWRWSRQALGPVGWLLGWNPLVKNETRKRAAAALDAFVTGR
jgi:ketosteroid isomerase-like protein